MRFRKIDRAKNMSRICPIVGDSLSYPWIENLERRRQIYQSAVRILDSFRSRCAYRFVAVCQIDHLGRYIAGIFW
ncbi:hypothetical protein BF95_03405 [Sphingobium sp. Ant17]|nr:hypothetical protein BF95_03405 [Sphingobium sp. Ant17]